MTVGTVTVIISIIPSILSIVPITLHALGIYLLWQPNPVKGNQKLYINLSILEILLVLEKNVSLLSKMFMEDPEVYGF